MTATVTPEDESNMRGRTRHGGRAHRIGRLAPGKQADLVLIDVTQASTTPVIDPIATVVHHAGRGSVDHVLVAGRHVKRDGRLVGVDQPELHRAATAAATGVLDVPVCVPAGNRRPGEPARPGPLNHH